MGKFSDVLDKLAERERLEHTPDTLPSPMIVDQQETDETSTSVSSDLTSEPDPAHADDPEPLISDDTISLEAEPHDADETLMRVPLDSASKSDPDHTDDPEPLISDDTISLEAEPHDADETLMRVPLDSASKSDPDHADDPEPLFSNETIPLEAEPQDIAEASTSEPLDSASDSEAIRLTQVWPFVAYDPVSVESEKKPKDKKEKIATSEQSESPSVSEIVHPIDPHLVVYHDPVSVEAEIFKMLRNNILFPKDGVPPPSIMITSATPGDGKSFIAANLAVSIAQGIEEHVLLMDCDMRRSSIHRKFGFSDNVQGLSEYLSKNMPLPSLLKKTIVEKLSILPGGQTPNNPAELLSSQRMKDLLDETKSRYKDRFIIVDSPPPQLTAETTALAKYIDGILIVVRSGKTPRNLVESLIEKLGREKIIGVVLNAYRIPATERYGYGQYEMRNYEQ
jgi:protein-tyrosine kinase